MKNKANNKDSYQKGKKWRNEKSQVKENDKHEVQNYPPRFP